MVVHLPETFTQRSTKIMMKITKKNISYGTNSSLKSAIDHAWQLIQSAQTITLLTHHKPDADGISACAALDLMLRAMGKTVEAIYPTAPESIIQRQAASVLIATHTRIPDLLIACDTANYERLYYPDVFKAVPLINIDHHISNSINGVANIVNGDAASTCEELYYIIEDWGALQAETSSLINNQIAACLLYGILYDSQVFHTQSTTPRTLHTAAACAELGADLFSLSRELLAHKNTAGLRLWGDILQNITIDEAKNAAWVVVRQADIKRRNLGLDALVGLNNFIAESSPLDVIITFYEGEDGNTKVSLRSKVYDVNALAKQFGGGGHKHAAGIHIKQPIDQAVTALTQAL